MVSKLYNPPVHTVIFVDLYKLNNETILLYYLETFFILIVSYDVAEIAKKSYNMSNIIKGNCCDFNLIKFVTLKKASGNAFKTKE